MPMAHHTVQTRRKKMMHETFLKKKVIDIIGTLKISTIK